MQTVGLQQCGLGAFDREDPDRTLTPDCLNYTNNTESDFTFKLIDHFRSLDTFA